MRASRTLLEPPRYRVLVKQLHIDEPMYNTFNPRKLDADLRQRFIQVVNDSPFTERVRNRWNYGLAPKDPSAPAGAVLALTPELEHLSMSAMESPSCRNGTDLDTLFGFGSGYGCNIREQLADRSVSVANMFEFDVIDLHMEWQGCLVGRRRYIWRTESSALR